MKRILFMENTHSWHPWSVRFIVAITILLLTFVGLILTNMRVEGAWRYWQISTIIIALLALGSSIYLKRMRQIPTPIHIGHEILHWLGLMGAVYITSIYVNIGIVSAFIGALIVLVLL